jgi:transposase
MPAGLVPRAEIILRSADGQTHRTIAVAVGVSLPLVSHWRHRFRDHRLAGLCAAARPGRPRIHDDDEVARLRRTVFAHQAHRRRALDCPECCKEDRDQQEHRAAVLHSLRRAAPPRQGLQAVARSVLHRESPRCRGPLPESAAPRARPCRG